MTSDAWSGSRRERKCGINRSGRIPRRPRRAAGRALGALLCFVTILSFPETVRADIYARNESTGYEVRIEDDAELLSESEKSLLADVMEPITAYGNVAFKSIDENQTTASAYARSYYYSLYGEDSGTLFLIDMDTRYLYIFSHGAVYRTVTDSKADTITDNAYRYASNKDYYGCAREVYAEIYTLLEGGRIAQPMKYASNAMLALILALLVNFGIVRSASKLKSASGSEILATARKNVNVGPAQAYFVNETRTYSPVESSSGGGGGGGRSGGGGGGGGGHSGGGGGGHRF